MKKCTRATIRRIRGKLKDVVSETPRWLFSQLFCTLSLKLNGHKGRPVEGLTGANIREHKTQRIRNETTTICEKTKNTRTIGCDDVCAEFRSHDGRQSEPSTEFDANFSFTEESIACVQMRRKEPILAKFFPFCIVAAKRVQIDGGKSWYPFR